MSLTSVSGKITEQILLKKMFSEGGGGDLRRAAQLHQGQGVPEPLLASVLERWHCWAEEAADVPAWSCAGP